MELNCLGSLSLILPSISPVTFIKLFNFFKPQIPHL